MKLLKQKEPDFDPPSASCQEGDTQIFGHPSPMDPVLGLLTSNCRKEELSFYLAGLAELIKKMKKEGKIDRYQAELEELQKHVTDTLEEDDTEPLPRCDLNMPVEARDIVTFEVGGPDFEKDVSQTLRLGQRDVLSREGDGTEALRLNKLTFSYGPHFDYSNTFNTSSPEKETVNETKGAKAKRYTVLGLKHGANAFVKVCKAFADVGWNLLKGIGDLGIFLGKVVGKSAVWTGAKVTALYAHVRSKGGSHVCQRGNEALRLAIGKNQLQAAVYPDGVQEQDLCWMGEPKPRSGYGVRGDQIIISRFVGDGTLDAQKYRTLAAERAKMHYSDTVGQWHRAVFGRCIKSWGTPGDPDYFEAVTPEKIKEGSEREAEKDFYEGAQGDGKPTWKSYFKGKWKSTKASTYKAFHTHDKEGRRLKPKAMFCSKYAAAVWSSAIGNPTADPDAAVRAADLRKMMPFNPGACSPWTLVRWIVSKSGPCEKPSTTGRKAWKSCIAEPGMGNWNPCEQTERVELLRPGRERIAMPMTCNWRDAGLVAAGALGGASLLLLCSQLRTAAARRSVELEPLEVRQAEERKAWLQQQLANHLKGTTETWQRDDTDLDRMPAACGILDFEVETQSFSLPKAAAALLAEDLSGSFFAPYATMMLACWKRMPTMIQAFRGEHDVTIEMATQFPTATFHAYEVANPALHRARANVKQKGLRNLQVVDAKVDPLGSSKTKYDFIMCYDVLHDLSDPEQLMREVRESAGDMTNNIESHPKAATYYGISVCVCLPSGLSADGGRGLGTLGFPPDLAEPMFHNSGFSRVRSFKMPGLEKNQVYEVAEAPKGVALLMEQRVFVLLAYCPLLRHFVLQTESAYVVPKDNTDTASMVLEKRGLLSAWRKPAQSAWCRVLLLMSTILASGAKVEEAEVPEVLDGEATPAQVPSIFHQRVEYLGLELMRTGRADARSAVVGCRWVMGSLDDCFVQCSVPCVVHARMPDRCMRNLLLALLRISSLPQWLGTAIVTATKVPEGPQGWPTAYQSVFGLKDGGSALNVADPVRLWAMLMDVSLEAGRKAVEYLETLRGQREDGSGGVEHGRRRLKHTRLFAFAFGHGANTDGGTAQPHQDAQVFAAAWTGEVEDRLTEQISEDRIRRLLQMYSNIAEDVHTNEPTLNIDNMSRRQRQGLKDILEHMVEETRSERARAEREREEEEAEVSGTAGTAADEQAEDAPNQQASSASTTEPAREPLPHPPEDELYRNEEELKNFLDECEEWIREWSSRVRALRYKFAARRPHATMGGQLCSATPEGVTLAELKKLASSVLELSCMLLCRFCQMTLPGSMVAAAPRSPGVGILHGLLSFLHEVLNSDAGLLDAETVAFLAALQAREQHFGEAKVLQQAGHQPNPAFDGDAWVLGEAEG
eukprot:g11102.t1